MTPVRCAIYVRKSNKERETEKTFLSIENQEMFVRERIMQSPHWVALPKVYSDNGYTGASLRRPALQELFQDIEAGGVDQIVVYRFDRLTRSLQDYTSLLGFLQQNHGVKIVSATEPVDTATPDGEFLLNSKVVYAQYERSITRARIKDKIAGSRKRGLWTGGPVPPGFNAVDKKLVIDAVVAPLIRLMFERFVECGSTAEVAKALNVRALDFPEEIRKRLGVFCCKRLFKLIKNPLYKGCTQYEGVIYPGQHEALIDPELWERAQALLGHQVVRPRRKEEAMEFALRGHLRCRECDRAMIINLTAKESQKYAYCTCMNKRNGLPCRGLDQNINVALVHRVVVQEVRKILKNPEVLGGIWEKLSETSSPEEGYKKLQHIDEAWEFLSPAERTKIIQTFVQTVWLGLSGIVIAFTPDSFGAEAGAREVVTILGTFYNRGSKQQVFVRKEEPEEAKDPEILRALVQAEIWDAELASGKYRSYKEVAEAYHLREEYVRRGHYMSFLAPKVKEAILFGRLSPRWRLRDFNRKYPRRLWEDQEALFLGDGPASASAGN